MARTLTEKLNSMPQKRQERIEARAEELVDQDRAEKIARMQTLVDEAVASGEGQRSMEQIEQEAKARLSASE